MNYRPPTLPVTIGNQKHSSKVTEVSNGLSSLTSHFEDTSKLHKYRLARPIRSLLLVKVILSTVLLAYAATSPIATTSYRALIGGELNVVNALSGADRGFSKAPSTIGANGADCTNKVQFGLSPLKATPGVTVGHMIYDLQLNTTLTTLGNQCWQVKLTYTTNNGALTTVGPVWIGTAVVNPPINQVIDCQFDMGSSLPSSPFSYAVIVSL
jgi:hypothetical protein